jgi:hypothetical protein
MPPLIWLYLTPLPGRSKYALALEWFSYAPHCLRCRPELVLLDAW